MAARKPGKVAAPVKQKLRKRHGPKRKMFHCWDQTTRLHFAQAGVLTKYSNFESFTQFAHCKGIKKFIPELWADYINKCDCNRAKEVEYFKNIQAHAERIERSIVNRKKPTK